MAGLDLNQLIGSITSTGTNILQKDLTEIGGFAEEQLTAIAQQAKDIEEATLAGDFAGNPALRDHFVNTLADLTRTFVKTLEGLAAITAEKLWNAIVKVVWNAIGSATGAALPLPVKGLFGGVFGALGGQH